MKDFLKLRRFAAAVLALACVMGSTPVMAEEAPVAVVEETDEARAALTLKSVTGKYSSRKVGEANRWYATASGGSGSYKYHYRLFKDGKEYKTFGWKTESSYAFTFTAAGTYTMQVRVQDAKGNKSDYVTGGKIVVTAAAPTIKSITTKYTEREVGTANRWTVSASGGSGAYKYHYRLFKNGVEYKTFGWKTENSWAHTFTEPGTYTMQVKVQDAKGNKSEFKTGGKIVVTAAAPVIKSVTTKYTERQVGTANRWTVTASGGSGSYQYHYRLFKDGVAYKTFGWKTENSWAHTFTEPGTYTMQVKVQDAKGNKSEFKTGGKIVVTAAAPVINSITTKYTEREVGTANRWTVNATGTGALKYHYRLFKDGKEYKTFGWKTENSWAFTFTEAGTYTMQVKVQDANGLKSEFKTGGKIVITAAGPYVEGGFKYDYNSNKTGIVILAYTGSSSSVVVPAKLKNLPVVEIGDAAFKGNTTLKSIDLPDTITVIGYQAFANCTNLSSMT